VAANRELIARMEKKVKAVIERFWNDNQGNGGKNGYVSLSPKASCNTLDKLKPD
jgi:hypothetical protein